MTRRPPFLLAVLVLVALAAINAGLQRTFLTYDVAISNLGAFLPLALAAIGQTYVILGSDIDLSNGAIASLVNVVAVTTIEGLHGAVAAGLAAGLAVGIAAGAANGFFIAYLRYQPIVTTFATGVVFSGLALWVLPQAGGQVPPGVAMVYAGTVLRVPTAAWILLGAALLAALIARLRFYRALRAVGGNIQAAFQTGLPVARTRLIAYTLSGLFAALSGLALVGETASGDPLIGAGTTLSSITAVVLGGTALSGCVGGVVGSVVGAYILGLIGNVIFFARVPFQWQGLIQGAIVLAAISGGVLMARGARGLATMNRAKAVLEQPLVIAAAAILVLLAAGELLSPGFASPRQLVTQLVVAALLGVVAAGQNLVILAGHEGIDLSVGGIASFGAFLAGNLMQQSDANLPLAVAAVLAACFLIGLANGLGVTLLRIPPLVMTLGMLGIVSGALVLLTRGVPSGRAAPLLVAIVSQPLVLSLPGIVFIWVAIGIALALVLRRTAFGFRLYAIGANATAAAFAGVPVGRTRVLVFGLSGLFSGIAGILLLGYTGNVFVGAGDQYMLPSIIAVVIGGTSLVGGSGGYTGTMAGAVFLVVLQSILTTLNIPPFGRQIVFGGALLALMLIYGRQRRLKA